MGIFDKINTAVSKVTSKVPVQAKPLTKPQVKSGTAFIPYSNPATTTSKTTTPITVKQSGTFDTGGKPVLYPGGAPKGTSLQAISAATSKITKANPGISSGDLATELQRQGSQGEFTQSSLSGSPTGSPTGTRTGTNPQTNVINAPNVLGTNGMNTKVNIPAPETTDYGAVIPPVTPLDPNAQIEADIKKRNEDYLKQITEDFNDRETAFDRENRLQKELQIKERQQRVTDITGQLNAVVNKGQAAQLSLVGQGRGIPEAIIGGQQAQIGRETAIQALPLQAQLSAAQGDLEMANDNLDRLTKMYSEEADREFQFKTQTRKLFYDMADAVDKRKFEKLQKADERAYQELKDLENERNTYSKIAVANNQSTLGSKIMKLDNKSPTFREDLAKLTSQIYDPAKDLEIKLKTAQLATEEAKTQGTSGDLASATIKTDLATSLLDKKRLGAGLNEAVGTGLGRGLTRLSGKRIDFINNTEQILNMLTLDTFAEAKAKGVTFGAASEAEWNILASAATPIANARVYTGSLAKGDRKVVGYNMSEKTMKEWLGKLSNPEEEHLNNVVPILSTNDSLYGNAGYKKP